MKISKIIFTTMLALFLVSCGSATSRPTVIPTSTSTPTPAVVATPVLPVLWPGLKDGWMTFMGMSYLNNPVYDKQGFLWANTSSSVFRWNVETGDMTEFTVSDGLPTGIRSINIFQDQIWVSSDKELAVYQDNVWVTYPLPAEYVSSFFATEDRLWVSASDGWFYLDGQEWKKFDLFPEDTDENPNPYYSVAKSKDGSLWFLRYGNALRFNGSSWRTYANLQGVQKITTLSDGTLLFVFSDLIMSFTGDEILPVVFPDDLYRYNIQTSLLTPEGDLWVRTEIKDYLIHNGKVQEIEKVEFEGLPEDIYNLPVALIPDGWVFNGINSLFVLDGKGKKEFSVKNTHPIGQITRNTVIGFSQDGALWSADYSLSMGMPVRFDGRRIESIFEKPEEYQSISKWVMGTAGSIWGMNQNTSSLLFYDVNSKENSTYPLYFNITDMAVAPNNNPWVASNGGFITEITKDYLRSGDFRDLNMIKIGEGLVRYTLHPSRIEIGPDGAIWVFAKDSGLYRYDGKNWQYYGLSNLQNPSSFAIDSKGHVWAGMCGMLLMNDGEKWTKYPHQCINPSNMIIAPDDSIWFINGYDGVYRFDRGEWTQFTNEQLSGVVPSRILASPDGAIWFISGQNWTRYKP